MAPNKFASFLHTRTNRIGRVLIYAILEWTLISLLLLNSLFSLLILKFARYFGLKPPCILCSRLDHQFSKNRDSPVSSYAEIICEEHASEISRIGYCSNHRKLVESQILCDDCSPETAPAPAPDAALFRWMREIGIVSDDDGVDVDGDDMKRCCCCDLIINPRKFSYPFVDVVKKAPSLEEETGDFVINQRELQLGSDSDPKFGYQAIDDDDDDDDDDDEADEEEEAEKQPLLKDVDDDEIDMSNEIVIDRNLCPDMLPQHLDFYIDHDDYRLIPVDLMKTQKEELCNDFELVFEGDDLVSGSEVVSKNLPCIQEDEEEQEDTNPIKDVVVPRDEDDGKIAKIRASDDDSEMLCSNEEKKIEERSLLTSQEDEDENEEEERKELQILHNHQDGNMIEERSLPAWLEQEVEEKKMEEDSLISKPEQEERSEVENVGSLQGNNENLEAESVPILEGKKEEVEAIEATELTSTPSEFPEEDTAFHLKSDETVADINDDAADNTASHLRSVETATEMNVNTLNNTTASHLRSDEITTATNEDATDSTASHLRSNKTITATNEDATDSTASHLRSDEVTTATNEDATDSTASRLRSDETVAEMNEDATDNTATHLRSDETVIERSEDATDNIFIQVEDESLTITDHVVREVSTSSDHLASVDNSHDGKQIEDEAEAVNSRDIGAEITVRSLNVNVALSHNEVEEDRIPDTPTSVESLNHLHKKLLLLGRRESATEESLDGISMISDLEAGEGAAASVEKLKSELQAERKALRAIYKELEEERNAAAIAANQTMAMINRLQEEKASMQMEALQYQRMMEEQSEYDQEALQMMNELMVKREKEKQELEKELEVYRKKLVDYEERERMRMLCRRRDESMRSRNSSASCSFGGEESDGVSVDLNHETKDQEEEDSTTSPRIHDENGYQDTPTDEVLGLQDSLASFEEERNTILEQLKALEEKLFTLAEEEEEHIGNMKPFEQFYEENGKDFDDVSVDHANGDENGFSHMNGKHQQESRINGSMQKRLLPLFDATELLESPDLNGKEDGFESLKLHKSPIIKFELEKKRAAIEEEVDHVYERLQAFEADREFLKHCIGSLRKGDKGLDLLQEILQHLRDLKNVELQAMKNMDHCASV